MTTVPKVSRALLSVSDKTGLADFARGLAALKVELVSTGGTAKALREAGLTVRDVSDLTGFPEMMDGRVKTLHPKVHGGLLGIRDKKDHVEAAAKAGIGWIDLVVVNLYPFEATVSKPGVTREDAVENIDIGGPSMVRSAAKNADWVGIVTRPDQYATVLEELKAQGGLTEATRRRLSAEAFAMTASYDAAISRHFSVEPLPGRLPVGLKRIQSLRYGENPHQAGSLYAWGQAAQGSIAGAKVLGGKELSYNNLLDADAAWGLVSDLPPGSAAIIKHLTPCGAAAGSDGADSFRKALAGDPVSAFGGIVALNGILDLALAEEIGKEGNFFEVIVAPLIQPEASEYFAKGAKWRANARLVETGGARPAEARTLRSISGGVLVQQADETAEAPASWKTVSARALTPAEKADAALAWIVCKHVKSNAIVLVKDRTVVGVGAGQMNRLDSVFLACRHAKDKARGAALASDAFFPFRDGPDEAAKAGVAVLVQPGGSIRDKDVIAAADGHGMAMAFTGVRHFRH